MPMSPYFKEEQLTAQKERNNNKGRKMTKTKVLRKLLIAIGAAFSEAASELDEVGGETETTTQEESTGTTRASKKKASKKASKKNTPKEDEMEEVESQFSDDPADFDDEGSEDEDDFAGMEEETKEVTVEDLRAALVAYAQKNTKEKAYKVLEKFGAKKANEVAKKDIAKAIAALKVK